MVSTRKNWIPQHCHHKAKGLGYVKLDGVFYYTGKWGTPEAQAKYDEIIGHWLANGRRFPSPEKEQTVKKLLVAELLLRFWKHCQEYYRKPDGTPTTEQDGMQRSLKVAREMFGTLPAESFGPKALKAVRERMIESNLARKVINQRIGRIKPFDGIQRLRVTAPYDNTWR